MEMNSQEHRCQQSDAVDGLSVIYTFVNIQLGFYTQNDMV